MGEKYNYGRKKTPTVIQMEAVECGAAALGIILGYHGRHVPLEQLRVDCGVSRDGSKASGIVSAAEKYKLKADGYLIPEDAELTELFEMGFPLIIHWEHNHFLVLEGVKGGKIYLNDPAYGPRTVPVDEFKKSFSGFCLQFEKAEDFEKTRGEPNPLFSIASWMKGSGNSILLAFLVSLMLIVPGLVIPTLNKIFIDNYLLEGYHNWFEPILFALALTSAVSVVLTFLQNNLFIKLETKFLLNSSYGFMWHLLKLPISFFNHRYTGDLISRLQANNYIATFLSRGIASAVFNLVQVIFYLVFMLMYNWILTSIVVFFTGFNILVYYATKKHKKNASYRVQEANAKLCGTTMVGNKIIESLKSSGSEPDFFSKWAGYQAKYINAWQKYNKLGMLTSRTSLLCTSLSTALVLGAGCYLIVLGEFTIGHLVAFNILTASFLAPINALVEFSSNLQSLEVEVKRLNDVMDCPIDIKHSKPEVPPDTLKGIKLSGHLELKNITFGYNILEQPLIEDFSLDLKPGSRVALVGTSGSGKSTIARLVTGLYQPWSGQILYGRMPIETIPSGVLAYSVSMVSQEPFFFKGTVRENLTMWDKSVPEETFIRAARIAEIYDEITTRNGSFESMVDEGGSNFSGGQLQRMEIARALLNNPSILILDEASSALDPVVEARIDQNLRSLGCTCLIIAHRVSTIRDCDEIVVMSMGKIVERGTHDRLIANNSHYCHLVNSEQ